jgi:hypothetical protein
MIILGYEGCWSVCLFEVIPVPGWRLPCGAGVQRDHYSRRVVVDGDCFIGRRHD